MGKLLSQGVFRPTLNIKDILLWMLNCSLGPFKVLKNKCIWLYEISWFQWCPKILISQQQSILEYFNLVPNQFLYIAVYLVDMQTI